MPQKKIVLLANSKKHGGRCIAGREITHGTIQWTWIRPVGDRPSHEVLFAERRYGDNTEPTVGDVLTLDVTAHNPHEYQTENWVLNNQLWVREQGLAWATIQSLAERPTSLWTNNHNTVPGLNDEVPHAVAITYRNSLCLVHIDDLEIHVVAPRDKKRVQARFTYNGEQYWLWITDVGIETRYLVQPVGVYSIGEACLTVSLSEPFTKEHGGTCVYKLVAAVITP
jgi:hypothetical protein